MELGQLNFILELIAVITGVVGVWYAKKENILVYPIGIISVLIWVYLCWIGKMYGQSLVNFSFFIINIFGWYNWSRKNDDQSNAVEIQFNNYLQNVIVIITTLLLWVLLYYFLLKYKADDEAVIYVFLEALITAMNFVAMFLLAWKRIENWIYWIIADIMCIPLFIHKDYLIGVFQFSFFIVIAFLGYIEWKKQIIRS
jgi:nicotinamide mononucleotide transporter